MRKNLGKRVSCTLRHHRHLYKFLIWNIFYEHIHVGLCRRFHLRHKYKSEIYQYIIWLPVNKCLTHGEKEPVVVVQWESG